jgi:hypothetical protein
MAVAEWQTQDDEEAHEVFEWRFLQLARDGFPIASALRLAASPVDIHEAARLLARGCPPDLALQILL